jgi:hypothetical protein
MAIAISAGQRASAPFAIACAISAPTAVWVASSSFETPTAAVLLSFVYTMNPP